MDGSYIRRLSEGVGTAEETTSFVMSDLDPRLTFEGFVVGPANRLAVAAARRAAESPGSAYNPLFLYSASGLGKSHILNAIARRAREVHAEARVLYQTAEGFVSELAAAVEAGERDELRERYRRLDLLLLDDVQFLTGETAAQDMLLQVLEAVAGKGKQVVLASDRPPADITGLDARLLSRFTVGLIVDIGAPEQETRMAIVRKKLEGRGVELQPPTLAVVARFHFQNVRELEGGLNRILALQDLEGREVGPEEASRVLGAGEGRPTESGAESPASLERLEEIRRELDEMGNPWPEAAEAVLRDPGRLEDAEALLVAATERVRPFPPVGEGPELENLSPTYPSLVVKAAHRLVVADRPEYNPLFLTCPDSGRARRVMAATGRSFRKRHAERQIVLSSAAEFAEEFARAVSLGVVSAWRERWWASDLLMVHGIEALSEAEQAQEEFFHLFEALKRRQARIFLAAERSPAAIEGIHDRLRSRFEGGLAVEMRAAAEEVEAQEAGQEPAVETALSRTVEAPTEVPEGPPVRAAQTSSRTPEEESAADLVPASIPTSGGPSVASSEGPWTPSPEKVVWDWPRLDERLVEDSA